MTQAELIFKIYLLVAQSGIDDKTTPAEWVKKLLYLHSKGWLWATVDEKNEVEIAVALYRIPSTDDKYTEVLPEKEEGRILYVPFFVSRAKDPMKAKKMLTQYLKKHEDVDEIYFEDGSDNKMKRFTRNKGQDHGKK
jgi:hypothetical protein